MPVDSEAVREKLNALIEEKNIPVVTFNSDIVGTRRTCFVGMDNRKSGRTAAGLLGMLTRGIGKILIITGYFSNHVDNQRVDGFVEEAKRAFPHLEIAGVHGSFDEAVEVGSTHYRKCHDEYFGDQRDPGGIRRPGRSGKGI